ncbi:TetR/AcrR family transcriptional regulator [Bordetella flabilis]|uniref:Transcriptional regulator n=1 Tax=Bordetella flabilis TaxID=463014 RepID=A0A193GF76_9BORD|nr:TetR/AcrR family transcriptional regulator [Bordetella flabilis]ANN77944.1 transcriptional regulator [Bordetella flabilis]
MSTGKTPLKPRKSPVQARSLATVEALHMATIQVLMREGLSRCTTTRVAARAGISVGSLYQYYPNRDALLAAVLKNHLDGIASVVDRTCLEYRGKPVSKMAAGLVTAFLAEKLRNPEESKTLYAVAADRGGAELAGRAQARMVASIAAMLASAPRAHFDDPTVTAVISLNALVGPVRAVLEGKTPAGFEAGLEPQLTLLLTAYFKAHRNTAKTARGRTPA